MRFACVLHTLLTFSQVPQVAEALCPAPVCTAHPLQPPPATPIRRTVPSSSFWSSMIRLTSWAAFSVTTTLIIRFLNSAGVKFVQPLTVGGLTGPTYKSIPNASPGKAKLAAQARFWHYLPLGALPPCWQFRSLDTRPGARSSKKPIIAQPIPSFA